MIKTLSSYVFVVLLITLTMLFPPNTVEGRQPPRILVNADADTKHEMSVRELVDIFTRRRVHWDDRAEILVVTQEADSLPTKQFLIEVLGITPYQYRSRLSRNTYSGRVSPPVEVSSEDEIIDKILTEKNAIGFIYNYMLYKDDNRLVIVNVKE